jgi:hypothetical protein
MQTIKEAKEMGDNVLTGLFMAGVLGCAFLNGALSSPQKSEGFTLDVSEFSLNQQPSSHTQHVVSAQPGSFAEKAGLVKASATAQDSFAAKAGIFSFDQ